MEQVNKTVQKLRFKQEDGSDYPVWEEKKLGEVADIIMGQSPKGEFYTEDTTQKGLIQGNTEISSGNVKISKYSTQGNKECQLGDILFSVRAPVGTILRSDGNYYIGRGISSISGNKYVFTDLSRKKESGYWNNKAQGTIFEAITGDDLRSAKIDFPSLPEQEKIGEFFSKLDERIEAQAKLIELLKQQKKGYSQQIFNGSLRFKQEDGSDYPDWEEKKLGDTEIVVKTGKKDANEGTFDGKYNFYTCSKDISKINSYSFEGESLLISGNGIIGDVKKYDGKFDAYQRVYVLQNFAHLDTNYLAEIISNKLKESIKREQMGTTLKYIRLTTIVDMKVPLPSFPEQKKIGSFLSALDNEIEQEENKLQAYKQEKQAYSQRMLG